jgi:acetyl esterase/lipase
MHFSKWLPWLGIPWLCASSPLGCNSTDSPQLATSALPDMFAVSIKSGDEIPLWGEQDPPGANAVSAVLVEEVLSDSGSAIDPQRTLDHIKTPTITAYLPDHPNGTAVLITAGGGYTNLVIDKEGTDIARWANSLDITAFVLKFRLPGEGWDKGADAPLQDGQRALRIIRKNAADWGIDPAKVGVFGFSSGGHTAAMFGTFYKEQVYEPRDSADMLSARPDFMLLAYGPHTCNSQDVAAKSACSEGTAGYQKLPFTPEAKQQLYDKYVTDLKVKANAMLDPPELPAPTFLVMAHDDNKVDPENALRFYDAVKMAGVSATALPPLPKVAAELHIFAAGSHGFAIRNAKGPIAMWTTLATNWLGALGIISEVDSISCHY